MCRMVLIAILHVIHLIFQVSSAADGSCKFTTNPINGRATFANDSTHILYINDIIGNGVKINYICLPNYALIGLPHNLCLKGNLQWPIPACEVRCSPTVISSLTFIANCQLSSKKVPCTEAAVPGTRAQINCQRQYHSQNEQVTTCDQNGQWNPIPHPCEQICGQETPEGTPFIIGGTQTNITKVPWHAGVYSRETEKSNFEHICGGSIINPKVVISAMHCFWNKDASKPYPNTRFRIAVGKYYRDFNHPDEKRFQQYAIEKIHYKPTYRDHEDFYSADIAIVVLNSHIEYKVHVAPVCIKYYSGQGHREVEPNEVGLVAGWGMTDQKGGFSDYLKSVIVNIVTHTECMQHMRTSFHPYLTRDKFCAGHRSQNVSVCRGDSGGGLVIDEKFMNKTTYYLRGIVSAGSVTNSQCDKNAYTTYLNTGYFSDLIIDASESHRVPIIGNLATQTNKKKTVCVLKQIPEHGYAFDLNNKHLLRIDDEIEHAQAIRYSCKTTSYRLIGLPANVCNYGHWLNPVPYCEKIEEVTTAAPPTVDKMKIDQIEPFGKTCELKIIPEHGFAILFDVYARTLKIGDYVDNVKAVRYGCKSGYQMLGESTVYCLNGIWTNDAPRCSNNWGVTSSGGAELLEVPRKSASFTQTLTTEAPRVKCDHCKFLEAPDFESCVISDTPKNGYVHLANHRERTLAVGDKVKHLEKLQYDCTNGYHLNGYTHNMCINGDWFDMSPIPRCELIQTTPKPDFSKNCPDRHPPSHGAASRVGSNLMVYHCKANYGLPQNQPNISRCIGGQWDSDVPNCIRSCNSLSGSTFQSINCIAKGAPLDCNLPVPIGTEATTICRDAYKGRGVQQHTCKANGQWQPQPAKCNQPICGYLPRQSHIPWHIGFYRQNGRKMVWQCSGTLIHNRVIISSRLCLINIEVNLLKAVAGKLHRDYDVFEVTTQIRNVERVKYDNNADHDYAIVMVEDEFEFENGLIAPVCVSGLPGRTGRIPADDGFAPAWRLNSDNLERVYFDIAGNPVCRNQGISSLNTILNGNKICASESNRQAGLSCAQLHGSGIVLPHEDRGETVYYLRGIATGRLLNSDGCMNSDYYLFLKIDVIRGHFNPEINKLNAEAY